MNKGVIHENEPMVFELNVFLKIRRTRLDFEAEEQITNLKNTNATASDAKISLGESTRK